ncbi:MAG: class I adenylate cyclase [Desulfamplus sp.]|nr:class I adenylate cyclase [Desulfamplus sp.]
MAKSIVDIDLEIENSKKDFLLHNIVRIREMIRYLPPEKLTLFKEIPFLVHINSPDFPGYVKMLDSKIFGVWNFENSGFAKDISNSNPAAMELLSIKCQNPAVQAIYHIGSLGTFTQSVKSDFDFWVVIDRPNHDKNDSNFIAILNEKLNLITTYSRKAFSQEVTFFIHYADKLRDNIFDNCDDDSVAVPELLLKEEFYRTFIMVAGKIPLWAVQPLDLKTAGLDKWKKEALKHEEFIDLGTFDSMPIEEIQRGLLWQICKAPYDPVKSVIKASITASYNVNSSIKNSEPVVVYDEDYDPKKPNPILLCDMVKQRFADSIIDDYAADPYIIAFERILKFYTELGDQRALSQIKAAIFFRLCGFPVVTLPPKDSPKRKILDRYVRLWKLSSTRLKKLLDYQNWSESEKTLFDHTMIDRLSQLYRASLGKDGENREAENSNLVGFKKSASLSKKERDLKILKNRVNKITVKKKGILPKCSTYLSLKPQTFMSLLPKQKQDGLVSYQEWLLFSFNPQKKSYKLLHSSRYFMEVIGWCMYNHLYIRGTTNFEIKSPLKLYKSLEKDADCDEIYLSLQPWMPLSDEPFLSEPVWERIVVLVVINEQNSQIQRCEFLIRNSWGEILFEVFNLENVENIEKQCYQIAMKILQYHEKGSIYSIFEIALKPSFKLIQNIKTIVEDTKVIRSSLNENLDINTTLRRPYLDAI